MKKIPAFFLFFAIVLLLPGAQAQDKAKPARPIKLLTIGNSLAANAMSFFPQIAEAEGDQVMLFKANPGGCSLERHAGWAKAFDANPEDPEGRPYINDFYPPRKDSIGRKFSLREALEAEKWDYVTLQQVTDSSFKPETFEPYGGFLIDYVHKYAPQAKILVYQTWAFREDYQGYGKDGFSQEKMYEALTQNYEKLARDHGLQVIPVGYAFQKARATDRWHFSYPDPKFDYKNPAPETLPDQPGSLNAGWSWYRPKAGGEGAPKLNLDFKHANDAGKYLAGVIFYEALFGKCPESSSFTPAKMDPKDAEDLRKIARAAYSSYPGPKATQGTP